MVKKQPIRSPGIVRGGYYISPDKSRAVKIPTRFEDDTQRDIFYDKVPDLCPICHKGIDVRTILAYRSAINIDDAQVIFQCPCQDCLKFFIGYYRGNPREDYYYLDGMKPVIPEDREFGNIIMSISPQFAKIFNEASYAEQMNLFSICGIGYRKALEFLIKDYVIGLMTTEGKQNIREEYLGDVIKNHIDHQPIKDNAERAVWLGNDESHYVRIWDDKDLHDLKNLIELTVKWIELVKMSQNYKYQMPQGKKIKK